MSIRIAVVAAAAVLALVSRTGGMSFLPGKGELPNFVPELGETSHTGYDPLADVKARLPADEEELLSPSKHTRGLQHSGDLNPNAASWRPLTRPSVPDYALVNTRQGLSQVIPLPHHKPWETPLIAHPATTYPRLAHRGPSPRARADPYKHISRGPRYYQP